MMNAMLGSRVRRRRQFGRVRRGFESLETRLLLANGISPVAVGEIDGQVGVQLKNVTVATYTVTDPSGSPGSKWDARIEWGDGTQDKKVLPQSLPGGVFSFVGSHTYNTAGNFTITVHIAVPGTHQPNSNNVTDTAVITPALTSITVTPANPSVPLGNTEQFTATGKYSDNTTADLTSQVNWASATTSVATIDTGGLATTVAQGTSTISATFQGVSGSTVLTVSAPALTSIAVSPTNPSVAKGLQQQFTAMGTYTDNSTADITGQVTWASDTTSVATIDSAGLASALATGTSTISATLSGISGSTLLTVTPAVLQSIAVTPANPSIASGSTQQFTATGTYTDKTTSNLSSQVTWASSKTAVATIDTAGLASGVGKGTTTISAALGGVTGSTVLTVTASLVSIAVTPANPSVPKGDDEQFTATGTYSDNSTADLTNQVTWASATTSVATINAAGLASTLATGTSTISATLGTINGSTTLTVTAAVLQSIAVTPANPSVPKGKTQQFTATGTFTDKSTQDLTNQVTWASATTAVATINAAGLATTVTQGTSTISAMLGSVSGSTVLTVIAPALTSIAVTPANPSVPKGTSQQFTATGTYSDNSTSNLTSQVTWASATTSVATINAAGLASTLAVGSSTISAKLGGVTGSTLLTVTAPVLSSIAVTPANPSVPKGKSQQFTATGTFTDSSTQDLTSQVTWASATTAVATINAAGLASTVAKGTSTISATLGGIKGSTVLTVTAGALTSIAVTPANPSVPKGKSQQFTATGTFTDNSTADITGQVTWASATTSVATINAAGLASAVGQGTSTISATMNGVTGSTVLTVSAPALTSIAVTPANPNVPKGKSQQFTATGTFTDSSTTDLTSQVTWASATTAVATINSAGVASTLAQGTSTISATLGGINGSTVLTVSPAALVSIAVTPANPSVPKGKSQQFTATGTFTDSSTTDLTSQVTWASATTAVATINAAGLASTVGQGTSTISAKLGAVTGSTVLTVSAPALRSIAVTPANPSVPKGKSQQFTATGTFTDNSTSDLTSQMTWASATTSVATINSAGNASTLAQGTSTISATLGGVSGSTVLTVSPAALVSIAVTPANPSVPKGKTQQFTATGTFTDNSTTDLTSQVTWASATTAVATINAAGLASTLSQGTSTISAKLGGVTGSTVLTVAAPALVSLAITPDSPSVAKGNSEQFTATGTFTDNSTADITSQVTWVSVTSSVATINTAGLASTRGEGTSTIRATMSGISGSTVLTVTPAALTSIAVTPANPSAFVGNSVQFVATGTLSDNTTEILTDQVTWSSSALAVATISATGSASALSVGPSTISATLNGVTGSTVLTVASVPPPLHVVSITPRPGNYTSIPNGKIVVTFSGTLAGLKADDQTGGGFASYPFAVQVVPQGPGGVFAAPSGLDAGSTPMHATLVYHVNANGQSTITLIPREPFGTDVYQIKVSGALKSLAGAPLTDASGKPGPELSKFTLITSTASSTALKVVGVTTLHASVKIANNAIPQPDTIAIAFNKPVDFLTTTTKTIQLLSGAKKTPITAAVAYSPTTKTVYLTPEAPLVRGTTYTISVAGKVTDDRTFPKPNAASKLGSPFTTTFTVKSAPVGPGHGPLVALSSKGHLLANPGSGPALKAAFGYASIPFSETVNLSSLGRSSVKLVPQMGGLNNNGPDSADSALNAKIAFNPNTNTLIIVPTVPIGSDVYRYYLTGIKAKNGDVLKNPGGSLPVTDVFTVAISKTKSVTKAVVAPSVELGTLTTQANSGATEAHSFRSAPARARVHGALHPVVSRFAIKAQLVRLAAIEALADGKRPT